MRRTSPRRRRLLVLLSTTSLLYLILHQRAKPTKVQCDESDDSESDDAEEYSKEDLMDMLEQAHT
jgi:hypothetical protein